MVECGVGGGVEGVGGVGGVRGAGVGGGLARRGN